MAVGPSEKQAESASSGRRFAIGTNVAISIVAAALLIVAVNWFCSLKHVRKDLASYGNYGLSDRTKRIVESCDEETRISVVYPPDEEDPKQAEYVERLQDYCDELERHAPERVSVAYITTDSQREKLVSRISTTFGGEATQHKEALESFVRLEEELAASLTQLLESANGLMSGDSWLGDFPLFANIASLLRSDLDNLQKTKEEIVQLTPAGGIPKYAEATGLAQERVKDLKEHFNLISERLRDLASLAAETSAAAKESQYIAMLREVAVEPTNLVQSLRALVGEEGAAAPPDVSAALKQFADQSVQVSRALEALVRRVDTFARKFPMVKQHPNWSAQARMGPIMTRVEVADVLHQAGKTLENSRLVILGVIDSGDQEELEQAIASARRDVAVLEQNATVCEQLLTELAARLESVDQASQAVLTAAEAGTLFGDKITAIESVEKAIGELPELKLGSVADQLKEDNAVVVETGDRIRVVNFGEMFPVRESVGGPAGRGEGLGRSFNGDSALSSSILALSREAPFATVVLTFFEPPPPQQRSPFMPPPPQSWIPSRGLSEIRQRLDSANFTVIDWNLATTKDAPPIEEGTEAVYVVLPPPPPAAPNPFGGQTPQDQVFGDAQRQAVRDLLDADARMLFLATWEVRQGGGMMGGPMMTPPYGYGPILEQDWGLKIDNRTRITWVKPDVEKANSFFIAPRMFMHMPVGGFTGAAIGQPLRGTRFLINDACPIETVKEPPAGVTTEVVLRIPHKENYVGASISDLIQIIDEVRYQRGNGTVTLPQPPRLGPFDVMVTAERRDGEASKGRIVVMGFGTSVSDGYLMNPVMAGGDTLRFDPEPTENVDLFVNALYWLSGHPEWIARGPVPVPRVEPIPSSQLTAIRVFVSVIWPVAVLVPGVVFWYIRRK
ncbi:MAG: hypothetical protein ABII12_16680 [Planctomycetota bacterium]